MESPELRKARIQKYSKWALGLIGAVAISPFVFLAVKGIVGLVICLVLGGTAISLAPVFSTKLANFKLKMLKKEAAENPIENMQNIYLNNMQTIGEKDKKIVQFGGRLGDYRDKMKFFEKEYPDEAPQFKVIESKMQMVLDRQLTKQKVAKSEAKIYAKQIEKAQAIWDMTCAAHGLTELAGDLKDKAIQDILKKVSFDAVTHSFNAAVAELTVEADTDPDAIIAEGGSRFLPPPAQDLIPAALEKVAVRRS